MNIVVIYGEIISKIEFKFIYDKYKDSLKCENNVDKYYHISIASCKIKLLGGDTIKVYAYDKMADYIYRKLKESDMVCIAGSLDSNGNVEVAELYK